ncbi:MFS transporter [Gorillibacterium sp. sgz500922]|uniref:MFS transporter n=1 Tax=Gorillibacterium sp. sgz500922 TaxID=3446694 RepID=UPI003F67AF0D
MAYPKWFRLLWTGQSISNLADSLYILTIVTVVYGLTGSALFSSLIPLARVAGQLSCGLLAPLLLDRFRLTPLIKLSQLLQVILFGGLALFARNMTEAGIPVALALVALLSFTDGITTPVRNSLIPLYAGKEALLKANGLMSTTDQTVLMLGWAGGGVVVAWIGSQAAMAGILGLYAISLVLTLLLREPERPSAPAEGPLLSDSPATDATIVAAGDSAAAELPAEGKDGGTARPASGGWASIREGWQTIAQHPTLRLILTMEIVEGLVGASWIGALLLIYVKEQIGQGTEWWGFLNGGYFAGAILGGLLVVSLTKRLNRNPAGWITLGAGVMGVLTLCFAHTTLPWLALAMTVVMGPFQQVREVTQRTVFQQACPERKLPKVMSAENTLSYTLFGLSVLLLSWLTDRLGIAFVYTLTGLFSLAVCLLAGLNRDKLQVHRAEEKPQAQS